MILDDIVERFTGRWALSFKGWLYLSFFGILGDLREYYEREFQNINFSDLRKPLLAYLYLFRQLQYGNPPEEATSL